ncbi:MAG: T9SS type A sorting domain-containing protein [Saprospiraceae bacterium]
MNNTIWILGILFLSISMTQAQKRSSVSLGNFYVPAKGSVAIFSDHNFQEIGDGLLPGVLATDRSINNGKIVFAKNSGWVNADNYRHIDGYVGVNNDGAFLLPTGDNGIYGPIGVSYAESVDAAYFAVDPSYATTSVVLSNDYTEVPEEGPFNVSLFTSNVDVVTDKEYWMINSDQETKVTLTWNKHSEIEALTQSELGSLTIVGWDGLEWVDIPSSLDVHGVNTRNSELVPGKELSNFFKGSITTDSEIVPNIYKVITLGRLKGDKGQNKNAMAVYPNPVSAGSYITVRYELVKTEKGEIKLYNSNNQLIYSKILNTQKDRIKIPLNKYGRGVFNIAISNENGHTVYKKLIVVDM